jgi:DNA-binding beta-propeller fold protein YncE
MRSSPLVACALLLIFATGCEEDPVRGNTPRTAGVRAVVTTTDFSSGALSVAALDGSGAVDVAVAPTHSDAVVRVFGGLVYVVNRFQGDNVQVLDPDRGFALVRQFSVGNGADPHDIAVVNPTRAYVTRYGMTELWIVNPSTGAHVGSVDLSPYADLDGKPEMDNLTLADGRVYVTLQRLENFATAGVGHVAVIDAASGAVVDADTTTPGTQTIALANVNPFSEIQLDPATGDLYVACVGGWGEADGGVEWVSPDSMASGGTSLSGVDAGGDITDVEIVSSDRAYAIVADASFATKLIAFDPRSGRVVATVHAPGDYVLQDIELAPTGDVVLADRTATAPGLRLYDAATGVERTTAPIDVGLPPFDIAFLQ